MTDKIHIVRATVANFMRLKAAAVELEPGKGLVRITGPNKAGKTSLLNAIHAAFGGAGSVPSNAIHEDATEEGSFVQVDLTNGYSVQRRFTEAGTYLTVTGPDGGKHGQRKLEEWVGKSSFDPMGFFSLKPKDAKEVLLGLSTDPDLPAKLEELDDRRRELYEGRTPYIVAKRDAGKVEPPEGERPDPVDVSGDSARLEELQAAQRAHQEAWREADAAARESADKIKEYEATIEELLRRLEKGRAMLAEENERQEQLAGRLEDLEENPVDHSGEIAAIKDRLAKANETSAVLEQWRQYDIAQARLEQAQHRERELTALIQDVDDAKDTLLVTAGPPIEGLTFNDDGEPMLNGRPLAQASGAERIRVAVEVALIANPDLAVCLVDEANDMDLDSLAALDELAKERGFQILACRIGLEGPGDVVVEDGVAKGGAQ